jgi:hypothetical protein
MTVQNLARIALTLLVLLLLFECIAVVLAIMRPSQPERQDLLTQWHGDRLVVGGSDGRWLVTHLENLTNHTIARLPEPIFIVESGGISFTISNLATLKWTIPAQPFDNPFVLETVPPPSTNMSMQALYIPVSRAKFVR